MPKAYASSIVDAPVEAVWSVVRDFNGLPNWVPGVASSSIEDGRDPDTVGCVRQIGVEGGGRCSERLIALDDSRYIVSYSFVQQLFPIRDHLATIELIPVTSGERTFVQWTRVHDLPGHEGETAPVMQKDVFVAGLAALAKKCAGTARPRARCVGTAVARESVLLVGDQRAGGRGMGPRARLHRHGARGTPTSPT